MEKLRLHLACIKAYNKESFINEETTKDRYTYVSKNLKKVKIEIAFIQFIDIVDL